MLSEGAEKLDLENAMRDDTQREEIGVIRHSEIKLSSEEVPSKEIKVGKDFDLQRIVTPLQSPGYKLEQVDQSTTHRNFSNTRVTRRQSRNKLNRFNTVD